MSEADGYSTDSEPANARLGVEQTGHLAFSIDTLTSLASEATFRLLERFTGDFACPCLVPSCTQPTVTVHVDGSD